MVLPICPPSACTPYCIPPPPCVPSCYFPSPCIPYPPPCTPGPLPLCYPPPPCTPYYPCTPSCPPPCNPPPPPSCCPPPSCRPKSGCCGSVRNNCCCSGSNGPKQIVCIPTRNQVQACIPIMSCCPSQTPRSRTTKRPHQSSAKSDKLDQQASYNNCNFYMTDIPQALRDRFCSSQTSGGDEECTEEGEETEECTDVTTECSSARDEDDCQDEDFQECDDGNLNKNDCPPPTNFQGNPWGGSCFPGCFPPGYPFGGMGGMGGFGGMYGQGGGGRGRGGDPCAPYGRGGRGMRGGRRGGPYGRGGGARRVDPCDPYGRGRRDPCAPYGRGRGGNPCAPYGGRRGGDPCAPYGGRRGGDHCDPYGGRRGGDPCAPYGEEHDDRDSCSGTGHGDPSRHTSRVTGNPTRNTSHVTGDPSRYTSHVTRTTGATGHDSGSPTPSCTETKAHCDPKALSSYYKRGSTARILSRTSGYRPYHYSNTELTKKSTAYMSKSQTTMKPSCSTLATTKHAYTSNSRTNVAPSSRWQTTGVGTSRSVMLYQDPSRSGMPSRSIMHKSGVTHTRSEPSFGRHSEDDEEEGELVPVYRTSTQTRLQIVERPDEPSEIRVIQRPVQEIISYQRLPPSTQNSRINLNVVTEDQTKKKRKKKPHDPCHPHRTCIKYHTRRLHRLCSFTNRRKKRLSQIHKPIFCFKAPPCPIRETFASILRKVPPPGRCGHPQKVPAFHEYCVQDECPDVNRYPLLTHDMSPQCGEHENHQHAGQAGHHHHHHHNHNHHNSADSHSHGCGEVEQRGVKRKQHHR